MKKNIFSGVNYVDLDLLLEVDCCFMRGIDKVSFALSCNPDVLEIVTKEASAAGVSRTQYINRLLENAVRMPKVLTLGSSLEELEAHSRLFSDNVLDRIPTIAQRERRSIDQMLLHLVELGIASISNEVVRSEDTVQIGLVPPYIPTKF